MTQRLKRQKNGAWAVYDTVYGETMHPGSGPWEEANALYVNGGGLDLLLAAQETSGAAVVFDVGLGAAANALAAVTRHQQRTRQGKTVRPMRLISFESDPTGAEFACRNSESLLYPVGYEDTLTTLLEQRAVELPGGLRWELRQGDFTRLILEEPLRADLIFFDPFSPGSNGAMWALPCLEALYRCRRPGSPTRLVTYSSAPGVRAGLLAAGFFVGEGPPGRSAMRSGGHTTVASTYLSDLESPLSTAWLSRWRRVRDPWPPMTPPARRRALREILLTHPQWRPENGESAQRSGRTRRNGSAQAKRPEDSGSESLTRQHARPPARQP